jgi:hypothetical protein
LGGDVQNFATVREDCPAEKADEGADDDVGGTHRLAEGVEGLQSRKLELAEAERHGDVIPEPTAPAATLASHLIRPFMSPSWRR